jgi:hypothetical protein
MKDAEASIKDQARRKRRGNVQRTRSDWGTV